MENQPSTGPQPFLTHQVTLSFMPILWNQYTNYTKYTQTDRLQIISIL